MATRSLQLYSGGTASGLTGSFARNAVAWGEDSGEVTANTERYDVALPRIPVPTVSTLTTNCVYSLMHASGTDSNGTRIFIHALEASGGLNQHLHFSHGEPNGSASATVPAVADGRRYTRQITGTPASGDLYGGVPAADTHDIEAASYFEDAVVIVSQVTTTGSVKGTAIAVGNYTAADGLSGNGGSGTDMDLIFCDVGLDSFTEDRVREWSTAQFVLRNRNELWVTVVDYKAKTTPTNNKVGWGILLKATRSAPGSPWTFATPEVVFDYDTTFAVDHTHNFGLALTSAANTNQGADKLVAICTYGDTEGENGAQLRYVDADDTIGITNTYTYDGVTMNIAFAETPTSRWANLTGWGTPSGTSNWTSRRTIHGQRTADGETYDWGSRQYVACCTGKAKNHLLMGADVGVGDAIVYFDVDAYDLDNDNILPKRWQRWGALTHFGKEAAIVSGAGVCCFTLHTDDPWNPSFWLGYMSQSNFESNSGEYEDALILGMADDDDAVRFSVVAREVGASNSQVASDGTVYAGFSGGSPTRTNVTKYRFTTPPTLAKPRQLGAGHTNYKAYWNHSESGSGTNQATTAGLIDFEDTPASLAGRTMGFATDAEITSLNTAIGLPGLGPVMKMVRPSGSAGGNDQILISNNRQTFPLLDTPMSGTHTGDVSLTTGFAEMIVAVAKDPTTSTRPHSSELIVRLGDDEGSTSSAVSNIDGADNADIGGSITPMTGDWSVFRILFRDSTTLEHINMNLVDDSGNDYQYEWYVMILAVAAYASTSLEYPIGYSGPSNTSAAGSTVVTNGGVALPDEVQTATGFGNEGTLVYHCLADAHGADGEWYVRHVAGSLTADHALCSLVEDANNYVEVGWRNGSDIYVKSRETGEAEAVQTLSLTRHLMRHDDFKIALRWSASGVEVDVWHNGEQHNLSATTRTPDFVAPTFKCGDQASSKTIPVEAFSVVAVDEVVTDDDLDDAVALGGFATPRTPQHTDIIHQHQIGAF